MHGFHHATILSPSFHGVRKERLVQSPPISDPKTTKIPGGYFQKNWVGMCGTLLETLAVFQTKMVLSPNDEEAANSSKKHTQFKTRVHKPYPISDQNGRNWYPISDQDGWRKHTLRRRTYPCILYKGFPLPPPGAGVMLSLAAYASETKKLDSIIILGTCTVTLKHSR